MKLHRYIPPLTHIIIPYLVSVLLIYQGKDFLSYNNNNHGFLNSVICSQLVLIYTRLICVPALAANANDPLSETGTLLRLCVLGLCQCHCGTSLWHFNEAGYLTVQAPPSHCAKGYHIFVYVCVFI